MCKVNIVNVKAAPESAVLAAAVAAEAVPEVAVAAVSIEQQKVHNR